ncbi:hypothetical protein AB0G15_05680 [Streptosporangium sp. NPDC023825]|uniref:hypothetical protein n=1 Tax=Streptosporangium sp. NPDC023825 TaxID=3154909 RepID=UPI0034398587
MDDTTEPVKVDDLERLTIATDGGSKRRGVTHVMNLTHDDAKRVIAFAENLRVL